MTYQPDILAISQTAYDEVRAAMVAAGNDVQLIQRSGIGEVLDMQGCALSVQTDKCDKCNAHKVRCALCGRQWCLDHQRKPLVCPGCGKRASEGS